MRKLAEGWRRTWWSREDEGGSEAYLLSSDANGQIIDIWPEDKAPPECFAAEPPPPPLVVDDVVEVIANTSYAWRQTRVVTHVFNTGSVSLNTLVLKPHEVKRIGHLDRTK